MLVRSIEELELRLRAPTPAEGVVPSATPFNFIVPPLKDIAAIINAIGAGRGTALSQKKCTARIYRDTAGIPQPGQ